MTVIEQAIDWHIRRHDLDEAGWGAFVVWLEQGGNAAAYDEVARLDGIPVPVGPLGANDNAPVRWRWWGAGAAVAAGLALTVGVAGLRSGNADPTVVVTKPGEARTLALADGSRMTLAGGSTVAVGPGATVDVRQGEALFRVRHDDSRAFSVSAGAVSMRDMGTVFDVVRSDGRVSVSVAEGKVLFQPHAERIALAAGDGLVVDEAHGTVVRRRVATDGVGGWTRGSLRFEEVPLGEVTDAVRRATGAQVGLTGDLLARPFTGTITLTGAADRDIPHFAALIGAKWRRDGERWIMGPEGVAAR